MKFILPLNSMVNFFRIVIKLANKTIKTPHKENGARVTRHTSCSFFDSSIPGRIRF